LQGAAGITAATQRHLLRVRLPREPELSCVNLQTLLRLYRWALATCLAHREGVQQKSVRVEQANAAVCEVQQLAEQRLTLLDTCKTDLTARATAATTGAQCCDLPPSPSWATLQTHQSDLEQQWRTCRRDVAARLAAKGAHAQVRAAWLQICTLPTRLLHSCDSACVSMLMTCLCKFLKKKSRQAACRLALRVEGLRQRTQRSC
jgi:hypothetical protein